MELTMCQKLQGYLVLLCFTLLHFAGTTFFFFFFRNWRFMAFLCWAILLVMFFTFFFGYTCGMWKFSGQGLNPFPSSDLSHCSWILNPLSHKGTPYLYHFPTAFAHFMLLCHILVILVIFQTFSLLYICYGDLWPVIFDFIVIIGLVTKNHTHIKWWT